VLLSEYLASQVGARSPAWMFGGMFAGMVWGMVASVGLYRLSFRIYSTSGSTKAPFVLSVATSRRVEACVDASTLSQHQPISARRIPIRSCISPRTNCGTPI
jgi:hypothetical protein